ncbi:Carboxylic ester hydrolase [Fusarium falciforme]|uniref:Carboxylic ester hydrolase n=1 Tax=Fusarium falciforme TaxID=195108 RepID=UPI0023017625|nr:Carboxylic ester hydrolase [Fusarium falciforme]WAO96796.1 Carboxylic ester hydrolase [Fusarium falciforme]
MRMTIAACDALDGKSDGVVSRTDLCKLHFDIDDVVGEPYSCDAVESNGSLRSHVAKSAATPAQSDIVMVQAAKLIKTYLNGPHDSDGRRIYLSSQCGSDLTNVSEWVARFLNLQDTALLSDFGNVTYDHLRKWITLGLQTN